MISAAWKCFCWCLLENVTITNDAGTKLRDGREPLPADSPVTKVNRALMKVLRDLAGQAKLAVSFFLN